MFVSVLYRGFSTKPPGRWDFFSIFFSMRLAKIKTPEPVGFHKYHALDFVSASEKLMINENRFVELRFVLGSFFR